MPARANHWFQDAIIYQVFTGRWESASILKHKGEVFRRLKQKNFESLSELGINCIYFLGIFDYRGPLIVGVEQGKDLRGRADRMPSPFAITDHSNVHPDLGTLTEFKQLVAKLKSAGMRVIVDYVAEHTSRAHPWVKEQEGFYHHEDEEWLRHFDGDVLRLDYSNPWVNERMLSVLETIASWGVDGVRCDLAHWTPPNFWKMAIKHIKNKFPDFAFVAEVYPQSSFDLSIMDLHLKLGFDAVYHGPLYNNMQKTVMGDFPKYLGEHITYTADRYANGGLVNYLFNHDDDLGDKGGGYLEALMALVLYMPGVPLIYNGTLNGLTKRLALHYVETLEDKLLEVDGVDEAMKKLFMVHKEKAVKLKRMNRVVDRMLVMEMTNDGMLLNNLGDGLEALSAVGEVDGKKGKLHQLGLQDSLDSGAAEVFI